MSFKLYCPCPGLEILPAPNTSACPIILKGGVTHLVVTAVGGQSLADAGLTPTSNENDLYTILDSIIDNDTPIDTNNPTGAFLLCVNQSLDKPTVNTIDVPCLGNKEYPVSMDNTLTGGLQFHSKENFDFVTYFQCNPNLKLLGYLNGGCQFEYYPDGVDVTVSSLRDSGQGSDGEHTYSFDLKWTSGNQTTNCIRLDNVSLPDFSATNFI